MDVLLPQRIGSIWGGLVKKSRGCFIIPPLMTPHRLHLVEALDLGLVVRQRVFADADNFHVVVAPDLCIIHHHLTVSVLTQVLVTWRAIVGYLAVLTPCG